MNEKESFSFRKRARSFSYAWKGIKKLVIFEHNARIHLVAMFLAIIAGVVLEISPVEWCLVIICIAAVLSAEATNSAVEALADRITVEQDPFIGRAKDFGAAAVLFVALGAFITGMIIFIPKLLSLFF